MARKMAALAESLTLSELKQLLAVKEQLTELEARKVALEKELSDVNGRIEKLIAGFGAAQKVRKKAVRKPTAKKTTRKKAVKKTVTKKKAVKKSTAKKPAVGKKVARKKAAPRKAAGKQTVEQVVVDLIRANGAPMPFQDILKTITAKKLVKSKSKNFANVLRRTLSTSEALVRAGRGIYKVK